MTQAKLNIFVRVIKRKMEAGAELESILSEYTNLTDEDKEQIRKAVSD